MVVHASAGAAVLAVLLVVGRRRGLAEDRAPPNSIPLTIVGAGILWFGWFGFNAGDGLQAERSRRPGAAQHPRRGRRRDAGLAADGTARGTATPPCVGAVSGAVAGLATITPCAGFVNTLSAPSRSAPSPAWSATPPCG